MDILIDILSFVGLGIGIIVFIVLLIMSVCIVLYKSVFGKRFEIFHSPHLPVMKDYPDIAGEPVSFPSDKDYTYYGSWYQAKSVTEPKGVIVFSHGIFDGHLTYMPEMAYFARQGYKIFGFDNTGCHLTGGKSMNGLPQSAKDLDNALKFVTANTDLPIYLFGHSWGGYAVSAVSCYNQYPIKAIFVQSGFNCSYEMVVHEGSRMMGGWIRFLRPYIRFYERMKFGKAAFYTAARGIRIATKNGAKCLILHSLDDKTIPLGNSVFANVDKNDNITFISEKHKGHNSLDSDRAIKYKKKLDDECERALGKHYTLTQKREYYLAHEDKRLYDELDNKLMTKILDFYNEA